MCSNRNVLCAGETEVRSRPSRYYDKMIPKDGKEVAAEAVGYKRAKIHGMALAHWVEFEMFLNGRLGVCIKKKEVKTVKFNQESIALYC